MWQAIKIKSFPIILGINVGLVYHMAPTAVAIGYFAACLFFLLERREGK